MLLSLPALLFFIAHAFPTGQLQSFHRGGTEEGNLVGRGARRMVFKTHLQANTQWNICLGFRFPWDDCGEVRETMEGQSSPLSQADKDILLITFVD